MITSKKLRLLLGALCVTGVLMVASAQPAVHPKSYYDEITYEWTDASNVTHTSAITEEATDPYQMVALLKKVYCDPRLPGPTYTAYKQNGTRENEVYYGSQAGGWNISNSDVTKPYEDGYTMLMVSVKDNATATPTTTSGVMFDYEYQLVNYFRDNVSSIQLLTDGMRIGEGENVGTVFNISGYYNRFFMISKGQSRKKQAAGNSSRVGEVGLNGAGKSTLMKIIAGIEQQYQGNVVWSPGYTVGYLPQDPPLDETKTVKENVMEGVQHVYDALAEYDEINVKFGLPEYYEDTEKMEQLMARQAELQDVIDATDAWNMDSKLERAMAALRCPPGDWSVTTLSGGERRRVALCRLLLQKPDVLLLDEPTNHLDAESIDWLEQHLQQYEGTVIAVTHDRYFLDDVAEWILELDRGEGIPWKGNYSSWLEQKSQRLAQEEKSASKRRKTLERELEWVRMAPKARHAKGKARLNSYDKMLNEEQKEREEKLEIFIPNGPRLGNKVIVAEHVAKSFPEKQLFNDLNFILPPNGIVGVIGPNGAGKTTLFRLIMGLDTPDAGTFDVGETVKLSYVDQQHKDIDPEKSVYQVVSGGNETIRMGGKDVNVRAYLSRFNFSGADQEKKCGVLSGGERNRLHLAIALKQEGNVLLLDEPTNDIDVNTLRALEEGLEAFAGCAVIISHDRWFLDRICTHILAFEGEGNVFYFEGNYSEYEANKAQRLGLEEPKRARYRKLMEE